MTDRRNQTQVTFEVCRVTYIEYRTPVYLGGFAIPCHSPRLQRVGTFDSFEEAEADAEMREAAGAGLYVSRRVARIMVAQEG